ncbi:PTS system, mannose-specific IIB component [Gammaproteobacteria bacterium]|nr:PTS system, mannose-specific IIB component [Gammaproteobacteria bacterium]
MVILIRVDDRLLHGQIICSWVPFVKADSLLVASDEAASDALVSEIISACGCNELSVMVKSVADTATYLNGGDGGQERVMLVVGELRDAMRLYDLGMRFSSINLGNIHHEDDGRAITPSIIVNGEDEALLRRFRELGVSIEIRDIPRNESKEYIP